MKTINSTVKTGAAVAATVAALFAAGTLAVPTVAQAADSPVQCFGVNSCKGHGECKTASNECKGMNSCKGQGWVHKASKAECESAGGHIMMEGK